MTDPLILLTTDFSAESARAYDPAVDLAAKLGGRILLVHVAELTTIVPHGAPLAPAQIPPDASELIEAAETAIASEAKKLGSKVPVETHVEAAADVAGGAHRGRLGLEEHAVPPRPRTRAVGEQRLLAVGVARHLGEGAEAHLTSGAAS